jgi:hypothetical protein
MTRYLVEAYTPATVEIADLEARARRTAERLSRDGGPVRYVRAIYVPDDELCLHLVDAASLAAADDLIRRAGISPDRIVEAAP